MKYYVDLDAAWTFTSSIHYWFIFGALFAFGIGIGVLQNEMLQMTPYLLKWTIMNHYCPEEMCEYDSKHLQKSMAWVSPRCNSGLLIGSPVRSWGLYAVKVCFLPVLMPAGQLPLVSTGSPVRAFDLVNKVSLVISESLSCVCWLGLLYLVNENVAVDWLCSFCSGCLYLIKQC